MMLKKIFRRGKKSRPREEAILNYIDLPPGGGLTDFENPHGRYAERPDASLGLPADKRLPNAPTNYAGIKLIFPIVQSSVTGAFRAALEDRRRYDPAVTDRSERAVVADAVLSGLIGRHGLRYAAGVYNMFNWQYSLPVAPYAAPTMPQNGRSFIFSLTLYK